jgi:hypothetical protein
VRSKIAILGFVIANCIPVLSDCAKADESKEMPKEQSSESQLLGVKVFASNENLAKLEAAAAKAGWIQSKRGEQGSSLILAPQPYRFEYFVTLIDGFEALEIKDMGLQLIGPDGRPVDADGNPIKDQ